MIHAEDLLNGNIIGIVDSYGAVHSRFTGPKIEHHSTLWPNQTFARWCWNNSESIHVFRVDEKLTKEQYSFIQNHLSRKFGLRWWDNGYHDIDDLIRKSS